MSENATGDERPNDVPQLPDGTDAVDTVEAYRTSDGVVLYDAENPLAWVKSTNAVTVKEQV